MGRKRLLSFVGGGIALIVVLVLKFVVLPKLELAQKKHVQWEDARSEIRAKFTTAMAPLFDTTLKDIDAATKKAILDCMVDRAIPVLNATGCDYYYVKTTTSREEATKKQTECLTKAGYPKKEADLTMQCMKEHMPQKWDFLQSAFMTAFLGKLTPQQVPDAAQRKKVAVCVAKSTVKALNASTCKPINRNATKPGELITPAAKCFASNPELKKTVQGALPACIEQVTGKKPQSEARDARPKARKRRHRRRHRH